MTQTWPKHDQNMTPYDPLKILYDPLNDPHYHKGVIWGSLQWPIYDPWIFYGVIGGHILGHKNDP